ncbi:flagellin [Vibrio mediterranei]|uniref:flagellin N-terminal helical domain-containing protein n=1 Tax=Vibrio mediterranei TaxID=689 RepID=UPI00148DD5F8|nr:flagellin [Vibrio mediterranei]NOI22542.1 Lateral flagellin [Vibrio mediterranei]
MSISVHTNYANLVTQNTLYNTNNELTKSLERLSTGFRINSAADDAAGLQIANRLEAQSRGMSVGMRNAQDAISMLQTSEGALDEVTNIAYRMNDLSLQAANGTNADADLKAITSELVQLATEAESILTNTNYGGQALLGAGGALGTGTTFQIGSTTTETLAVGGAGSTILAGFTSLSAAVTELKGADLTATGGDDPSAVVDLLTVNSDTAVDGTVGSAADGGVIGLLGTLRSELGANINRLDHTITNLGNMVENIDASKGRIMDTNFASESGMMSKQQMLMQSGASMLSASKMVPQLAMSLLG